MGAIVLNDLLNRTMQVDFDDLILTVGKVPCTKSVTGVSEIKGMATLTPNDTMSVLNSVLQENKMVELQNNGEVDFSISVPGYTRFRGNAFRQRTTYSLVLRKLKNKAPKLSSLNLPDTVREIVDLKKGLVLVTGVVNSGKTTTINAILNEMTENYSKHIVTLEDPIEYFIPHGNSIVNQREIGVDTRSFKSGIRAALREGIDVIMVGEMRDTETIQAALTAAETGHVVISTLHTRDCAGTITRIVDSMPESIQDEIRLQLSLSLSYIISQQLLPSKADVHEKVVACELFKNTIAFANLIRDNKIQMIKPQIEGSRSSGVQTMDQHLGDLVKYDAISYATGLCSCSDKVAFERFCK